MPFDLDLGGAVLRELAVSDAPSRMLMIADLGVMGAF